MAQFNHSLSFNHSQSYGNHTNTIATPTIEQLLSEEDVPRIWSPTSSSPTLGLNHDPEENLDHHHKKSVFTKVKEKAKKLRHTLSNKKKHNEDENATPSWGYNLEEDEDEEDIDAEYLGAPMYESELAPEDCKENARQHPRAEPVIAENHMLASLVNDSPKHNENHSSSFDVSSATVTKSTNPMKEMLENKATKASLPTKTLTETVSEKLAPVYSTVTDATHAIASKIHSLTVTDPADPASRSSPTIQKRRSAPAAAQTEKLEMGSEKIWDKGVSVKEYLMHKFEPGEDERALSQVLSEAMSPKRNPGDSGVVEKVRAAVNSMLRAEARPQPVAAKSSSNALIFSNNRKGEEESFERKLQAN